jgi:hypothetical protein
MHHTARVKPIINTATPNAPVHGGNIRSSATLSYRRSVTATQAQSHTNPLANTIARKATNANFIGVSHITIQSAYERRLSEVTFFFSQLLPVDHLITHLQARASLSTSL